MATKKAAKAKATKTDKTNKILVSIVLDKSGSMSGARMETISGFNVYVDKLREDKKTEYSISLTQFDMNQGPELTVTYADTPLAQVKPLTAADYEPRGGTPLYDAIGECIRRIGEDSRGKIMVVITDGEENSSREFSRSSIKALIKSKEKDGWTFVFLGSDIDAYKVGGAMGSSVGNTSQYNKVNTVQMFAASAGATMTRSALYNTVGAQAVADNQPAFFSAEQKSVMTDAPATPTITVTSGFIAPAVIAGVPQTITTTGSPWKTTSATPVGSSAAPATFRTTVSKP